MLVLTIGDSHLTGKNPIARIDDLVEVQFEKWEEIVTIANKYNCPIISVGDILNVPVIANSILTKFGNIINKLKHGLYFVWGNHDLMYHSIDMFDRTSLGMLWYNNSKIRHISEFYYDYGIKWDYCDWNQEISNNEAKLLLIHKAVIDPKMVGGDNSWILKDKEFADNIKDNKSLQQYDLIICGHWHKKYRFKYKNTQIINPGPIVRRTINDTDLPVIQLIDLETKLHKVIKLKSVKPTIEVISDKHIEENAYQVKVDILEFINALKNKKLKYTSSFMDNLMVLLDSHELDKDIEQVLRMLIVTIMEKRKNKH